MNLKEYPNTCNHCGSDFTSRYRNTNYCSESCRYKAWNKNDYMKIYREAKKEEIRIQNNKWRNNHRDNVIKWQKKARKKATVIIADSYVIECMIQSYGLRWDTIKQYPELIESYRQQIKLKRILKQIKNETKKTTEPESILHHNG